MFDIQVRGLSEQIAAEEVSGFDKIFAQIICQLRSGEACIFSNGDGIGKPGGVGTLCCFGEDKIVLILLEAVCPFVEIAAPRLTKIIEFLELLHPYRRLHIGHFQVVADMRINIFMVVTGGERSVLPRKPFSADIALARPAETVAAPIFKRLDNAGKRVIRCERRTAFAGCDMVRGVKREGGKVAE